MPLGPPQHSSLLLVERMQAARPGAAPVPGADGDQQRRARRATGVQRLRAVQRLRLPDPRPGRRAGAAAQGAARRRPSCDPDPASWPCRRCRPAGHRRPLDRRARQDAHQPADFVVLGAWPSRPSASPCCRACRTRTTRSAATSCSTGSPTATAIFLDERLHAGRGRSTTHAVDDFADPDFPGARAAAQAAGLPYFRGGTIELGGTQNPISEANTYRVPARHPPQGQAVRHRRSSS